MAVRKFKPVTPGQRNKVISAFDDITTKKPQKSLLEPLKSSGGRNNTGQMTVRYIGGGHKRMYRIIDFLRDKDECTATVQTIEYDPNRSARAISSPPTASRWARSSLRAAASLPRSATPSLSVKFL